MARNVLTMGLYKCPSRTENSVMPYVYTCPAPKAILSRHDRLFVYGNHEDIKIAEAQLNLPFIVENMRTRLGNWTNLSNCVVINKFLNLFVQAKLNKE